MKPLRIFLLLLAVVSPGLAEKPPEETWERLAKVESFSFGPFGRGASISQGQKDYEELLGSPNALADLLKVFEKGTPAAKCYALAGIEVLNPKKFKEISAPLSADKTKVPMMSSSARTNDSLGEVLHRIANGNYRTTPGKKSYTVLPSTEEETFKLLEETIIPIITVTEKPVVEAFKIIQDSGDLKRLQVSFMFLHREKAQRIISVNLRDVNALDGLRVVCTLSGLQFTISRNIVYIFDPSAASEL